MTMDYICNKSRGCDPINYRAIDPNTSKCQQKQQGTNYYEWGRITIIITSTTIANHKKP